MILWLKTLGLVTDQQFIAVGDQRFLFVIKKLLLMKNTYLLIILVSFSIIISNSIMSYSDTSISILTSDYINTNEIIDSDIYSSSEFRDVNNSKILLDFGTLDTHTIGLKFSDFSITGKYPNYGYYDFRVFVSDDNITYILATVGLFSATNYEKIHVFEIIPVNDFRYVKFDFIHHSGNQLDIKFYELDDDVIDT